MLDTTRNDALFDHFVSFLQYRDKRLSYVSDKNVGRLRNVALEEETVWVTVGNDNIEMSIELPRPLFSEHGLPFIRVHGVERALGSWLLDDKELAYWELMRVLFCEDVSSFAATRSPRPYFDRLAHSFRYNQTAIVFANFQKLIDEFINKLPLVSTPMQKWAMCNRIQVIDPAWDNMSPSEKLAYQVDLNMRMFPFTSLGQSDSGMCQNTLLKVDVRKSVPFGIGHHNPHRNLYQTLGMKGDEEPVVYSHYEHQLKQKGIVRKGWNLLTAFLDVPSNFEDQILVSPRLANLTVTEECSFTVFGMVIVEQGDDLSFLHPLAIEPTGDIVRFNRHAESAWVSSITKVDVNFNGQKAQAHRIKCKFKRKFKDGVKLTNRHGNKGIIHITETGFIRDPVRGNVPIDIIVSASSVQKRRNFGQLYEALLTLVRGIDKEIVLSDNVTVENSRLKNRLVKEGYREDGTVDAVTKWGTHKVVAGWVHWGCIKTPEDQLWIRRDTTRENNNGVRVAGNKVSHIELRGLITTFGPGSPVIKEILQHRQGEHLVFSTLEILERTIEQDIGQLPILNANEVGALEQRGGSFYQLADFSGTVGDVSLHPNGFWLKLPKGYKFLISVRGMSRLIKDGEPAENDGDVIIDKIFVPRAELRKPWKHGTGLYGFTDIAALANNVILFTQQLIDGEPVEAKVGRSIYMYLNGTVERLTGKTGLLATYSMAVRYPNTVKATASVSEYLDKNEIEIHYSLARQLRVKDGDYVLVERFPCLGFMSLRVQRVRITDDEMARYVIRVSGNSLASQNLDFDGDVIYLMSFHTPQAVEALEKEFHFPAKERLAAYNSACDKKVPQIKALTFDEYNSQSFGPISRERNAEIVAGLTGIKRGTGTVVALCYNIMRIVERTLGYSDEHAVGMELLLDKVANSVFSQKHAGRSLEAEAKKAICLADVDAMLELGFDAKASKKLAEIIVNEAKSIGISESGLKELYYSKTATGGTSIINMIVRRKNKIWFASRSSLRPVSLVRHLRTKPCDIAGHMFMQAKEAFKCQS